MYLNMYIFIWFYDKGIREILMINYDFSIVRMSCLRSNIPSKMFHFTNEYDI